MKKPKAEDYNITSLSTYIDDMNTYTFILETEIESLRLEHQILADRIKESTTCKACVPGVKGFWCNHREPNSKCTGKEVKES